MRNVLRPLIIVIASTVGLGLAESRPPKIYDEVATSYSIEEFGSWPQRTVDGRLCRIASLVRFRPGYEANHHRIIVDFTGKGSVELSLAHSSVDDLDNALAKAHLHSRFKKVSSGKEVLISSAYRGERFAWLLLHTKGQAKITDVRHVCWRGRRTLYGHVGRSFEFGGAKLPYRLLYPRNYDPAKAYPLVLSVSGSGGIGTKNRRNMERVILGRYLFTQYYYDEEFACFSLVPQIPPPEAIPALYHPKGRLGKPTPIYHPGWPIVNESGWYSQATLALIRSLIEDKALNIDPERVYYTGFSYGGKACWEFLKAGRGLFAAAMSGGGWPIGPVGAKPAGKLLERLGLEVQRYKHIPVFIFAGELDPMRFGSRAVHQEILAQGGKSTFVEFPKTKHVASALKAWSDRKRVAWLFKQNRKNNPSAGEDPFGNGAYLEED